MVSVQERLRGRGFYLTPSWSRAWEMGKRRKNIKQEGEITVNPFSFSLEAVTYSIASAPKKH